MKASAPGSLMLLGEHAVLHGRRALVCAINKRIAVCVSQCSEEVVRIVSDLGIYEAPLGALEDHPDFRFVLDTVRQYPLTQGIKLKIESEFSSDIGFGSSAAVTVATHAALMGGVENRTELFKRSLATIHRVQGRGSGADVAASVFGGVVAYRAEPLEIHTLEESFPLTAVYSGSKMKTADVIRYLEERRALNADYFERIFDRMDASVGEVLSSFGGTAASPSVGTEAGAPPLQVLGKMLILNQKLMEEMGLCNAALAEIIEGFQTLKIPAKISGSGLGDCAIGLGKIPKIGNFKTFALQVESCGVQG
jgi:mevalonate kinase